MKVRRKLSTLYVVLIIAFLVAPAAIAVPVSFNNIPELEFPPSGFSLQWYAALFNSSSGWRASMALSAEVAISATAIALLVGAPAAWALMRRPFRFRRAVLILLVAPLVVPTIVLATGQFALLLRLGSLNPDWLLIAVHAAMALPIVVSGLLGWRASDRSAVRRRCEEPWSVGHSNEFAGSAPSASAITSSGRSDGIYNLVG